MAKVQSMISWKYDIFLYDYNTIVRIKNWSVAAFLFVRNVAVIID